MRGFQFYTPTRIVFGPGAEEQAGRQISSLERSRALVVYGGHSAVKSGLLDRVLRSLAGEGIVYETFGGVQPNPRLALAREGIKKALDFRADLILGVGGGSVLDTAKAVAIGAADPSVDIWEDLWLKKKPPEKALPVGAVLTIPAAGSECSDSAVLTRDDTHEKRGLSGDLLRPKFALMNPELTFTLPKYQVSCGVVDIMMHTLDRYFNPAVEDGLANDLTDGLAEALLRCVIKNGREALKRPGDYQAMSELMWAGSLSHNGLTGLGGARDFSVHQLGHELSAMFDVAHGASLSAVWDSWARYCVEQDVPRFARLGVKVWGLNPAGKDDKTLALEAIEATKSYFRDLDMPVSLPELGIGVLPEEKLEELARRCTFYGKRKVGAFRVLEYEDLLSIYKMANSK